MSVDADVIRGSTPSPSSEPESAQDEEERPDARPETNAGHSLDAGIQGPTRLAPATKRKHGVANAEDEEPDASEASASKRRKKGDTEPEAPKVPKIPGRPIHRATKPAAKKPQNSKQPDARNAVAVAQGTRHVDPIDSEALIEAEEDGDLMETDTITEAGKFAKEQERARFGAINAVRLSKRTRVNNGLLDSPMNANLVPGIPSREQRLLESFFIPVGRAHMDSDDSEPVDNAVAQRRMDYVSPYTEPPEKGRTKPSRVEWRKLSLMHRLNLIEGIQEIEKYEPEPRRKDWDSLRTRARKLREELMKGQTWLAEPSSWDDYHNMDDARKPRKHPAPPKAGGKKDDDDDDEDDESGNPAASTKENMKEKVAESKGKERPSRKDSKAPLWTQEHEDDLRDILNGEQVNVYEEEATPPAGQARPRRIAIQYTKLELEMLRRCIEATKETDESPWTGKSENSRRLARAHELFFRKWPLPREKDGSLRDPRRRPDAMHRRLLKDESFKTLFEGKPGKGSNDRGRKGPSAKPETGSGNAQAHPKFAGKKVPDGKNLPDDEDDEDDGEALDDDSSQANSKVNGDSHPLTARKGPAKTATHVEEGVRDAAQDGSGILDEEVDEEVGEEVDEEVDEEVVEEVDEKEESGDGMIDVEGGSSGSDDLDDTRM